MTGESTLDRIKHFLRRHENFVFLLGYAFLVVGPMPIYVRFVPAYILFPLLQVVPILVILFRANRRTPVATMGRSELLRLLRLAVAWTAVVVLTHARTMGELKDDRSALSWWVGGGLVIVWLASALAGAIDEPGKVDSATDAR